MRNLEIIKSEECNDADHGPNRVSIPETTNDIVIHLAGPYLSANAPPGIPVKVKPQK